MKRFRYLLSLSFKSAWNRKATLSLVVFSIAISVTLLLGIEKLRSQVRENFVQAISGTDLIVGARGGDMQLMLYAIFHLGGATNNMGWDSAQKIAARDEVAWIIPISLGDSHKGYPVVATTNDFFKYYKFQGKKNLILKQGKEFENLFDVIIGSEVAKKLNYVLGQKVILSHGNSGTHLTSHSDKPFVVTGILAPTGTPVDRSFYISLSAMEAIHLNWRSGAPIAGFKITPEQVKKFNLEPKNITALLVGLKRRAQVFAVQREINESKDEALMGIMPGVAMDQIWRMVGTGEKVLLLICAFVTVTGLAGLAAVILASLGERRRELAILRSTGAKPKDILVLLACEGCLLIVVGLIVGLFLLYLIIMLLSPILIDRYGIFLYLSPPSLSEWKLIGYICLAGFLTSFIPALRAYCMSLSDGLTVST